MSRFGNIYRHSFIYYFKLKLQETVKFSLYNNKTQHMISTLTDNLPEMEVKKYKHKSETIR